MNVMSTGSSIHNSARYSNQAKFGNMSAPAANTTLAGVSGGSEAIPPTAPQPSLTGPTTDVVTFGGSCCG